VRWKRKLGNTSFPTRREGGRPFGGGETGQVWRTQKGSHKKDIVKREKNNFLEDKSSSPKTQKRRPAVGGNRGFLARKGKKK